MDNIEPTVVVERTDDGDLNSVSMVVKSSSDNINNEVNDNQGNDWIILATIRHKCLEQL